MDVARKRVGLEMERRREVIEREILNFHEKLTMRGIGVGSGMVLGVQDLIKREYEIRADIAWQAWARALSTQRAVVTHDLRPLLVGEIERVLEAESQDLQDHYTRAVTMAHFGGNPQQTLLTMRSKALERASSEIDYAILEATRTQREGAGTANFAFYAPVGAVLSGPGSTATVNMSLGPAERETVVQALVAVEQAVAASPQVPPTDREQLVEVVTELKEELKKEKPNSVRLRGGLSAVATLIQTMGSAKGAYELLKGAAALFGLHLP